MGSRPIIWGFAKIIVIAVLAPFSQYAQAHLHHKLEQTPENIQEKPIGHTTLAQRPPPEQLDPVFTQLMAKKSRELVYSQITSDDGLSENVVNAIIQDQRGFMWIATHHGLNRYDGYHFKKYYSSLRDTNTISDNTIKCLALDSAGMLWVGTSDGLNYFNPKTGTNQRIDFKPPNATPSIKAIHVLNLDTLYFSLRSGEVFLLRTNTRSIEQVINNHKDVNRYTRLVAPNLSPKYFSQFDHFEKKFWIASTTQIFTGDIKLLDIENIKLKSLYNRRKAIPEIRGLFLDKDHNLWIATFGDGILLCKANNAQFRNIEVGTVGKDSIKRMIFGLFPWKNGEIAAESGFGNFFHIKNNAYSQYYPKSHFSFSDVISLTLGVSDASLSQKQLQVLRLLDSKGLLLPYRFSVLNDSTILTTGNTGLVCHQPYTTRTLSRNFSSPAVQDGQYFWTATTKGLFRINRRDLSCQVFLHEKNNLNTLNENNLYSLYLDVNKKLWIGTKGGGLNYFDPEKSIFKHFSVEEGLPDNVVYFAVPDRQNNLWLGTNKGLCRFNMKDYSCRNYSRSAGLSNSEFNRDGGLLVENGYIYLSGTNGIDYFDPNALAAMDSVSPEVQFSTILVNGEAIFPTQSTKQSYSADQNNLDFYFTANYFSFPKLVYYRYRISTEGQKWQRVQGQNHILYHTLAPDSYTFEVQASLNNILWSDSSKFEFEILPKWHQRWWAKTLLAVFGIYLLYWYLGQRWKHKMSINNEKLDKQLAISRERERISADLHDDVGSTLSSISVYSELAQKHYLSKPEKTAEFLDKIVLQTRLLMNRMEEIIWSLQDTFENQSTLAEKIDAICTELLLPKNITYTIEIAPSTPHQNVADVNLKNIELIVKEAINNCGKYSKCENVKIVVSLHRLSSIQVSIRDDGVGFDQNTIPRGNGLRNMQARALQLGGTLTIESKKGLGTTIQLDLPIPIFSHSQIVKTRIPLQND